MEKKSKGRSRPMPDASNIKNTAFKLEEAIANETQNTVISNYGERKPWEVTMSARDGAVHVLRFLKAWFDLPQPVFFSAVSYLDQFLARMKVQAKYLSCVSVSCFKLAADHFGYEVNASRLVMLSQSRCSVKDIERMSTIISQKLNLGHSKSPSHVLDLLKVYMDIFKCIAVQFKTEVLLNRMLKWQQLCTRLEIVISDSSCAFHKPSVLALAFIQHEMERFLSNEIPKKSNYYSMEMFYMLAVMIELQSLCKIKMSDYSACAEAIKQVLGDYDGRKRSKHSQKLTWQFSSSTLAIPKLSQYYYSTFGTIKEE